MTPKIVIRRRIRATPDELFDAWTNPDGMRAWICPGNIVSAEVHLEARVGGSLLIVMRDSGRAYEHRGEFTIVDRPSKLAFTWIADATDQRPTLVTVEFLAVSESESDIILTHENLPEKPRETYRGGWAQILDHLEDHLNAGSPN